MKNVLAKSALSLLLSSTFLISGGISVLADEQTPDDSVVIEVEEDRGSEDAAYGTTSSGIALNATNFPDATFRDFLKQTSYDLDGNGYLSETEIDSIKRLYLSHKDISSLKGIEYLTNLCELYIQGTKVTSVDLSANPGLKKAYNNGTKKDYEYDSDTTEYEYYNDNLGYPLRTLRISNNMKVTFSSGLGWNKTSKGWWFKNADGSYPKDGLKQLGGFLFYFDKNGYIITNTWKEIDGEWYRFNNDGEALAEWQNINGKWYYFGFNHKLWTDSYLCITEGVIITGQFTTKVYHVDKDGVMQTGWQFINDEWRYFNSSGEMQTGWVKVSGKWYYFEEDQNKPKDPKIATMYTGWKQINGVWYYFKPSGAMAADEFYNGYWLNANGSWTYQHKASWRMTNGKWWFGDDSGWYAKDETVRINDKDYNFDANGYCTNP